MKHWLNHSVAIATILFSLNGSAQDSSIANNPSARAGLRSGVVGRAIEGGEFIGAELATYELSTVFATVGGRRGESRVFDGILYVPGSTESPVVGTLNLQTGETSTLVMEGGVRNSGIVSGIFKKNGEIFFTGVVEDFDRSYDVAIWDRTGKLTLISDATSSPLSRDVSSTGRIVLSVNNDKVGYIDASEKILRLLPGVSGFNMAGQSIADDNSVIGAGGYDASFNTIGVVYELNSATGEYRLSDVEFKASRGEKMNTMHVFDSVNGPLSASFYLNQDTFEDETAIFSMDGTLHAELPGIPWGNVAVGDKFVVATQGLDGYLTVFNSSYQKKTYTATEIFGATGIEFKAGSLAVDNGKIVIIGTRTSDGKVFVKTFEVPQDVTLSQVDVNSINIPSLVVGQSGNITWGTVEGATGYDYQISQGSTIFHAGSTTGRTFTTPSNLPVGEYTFAVRATAAGKISPEWSEKSVIVQPRPVLASTFTLPRVASSGPVTFSWTGYTGATYEVVITPVSATGRSAPLASQTVSVGTLTLTGGIVAGEYTIQVCAIVNGVKSAVASMSFAVKLNQVSAAGISGLPIAPKESFIAVEPVPGATGYYFWVSKKGQDNVNSFGATIASDMSTFYLRKLVPGEYNIWVKALGATSAINADWSTKRSFQVKVDKVDGLAVNQVDPAKLTTVSWNAEEFANNYRVWISRLSGTRAILFNQLVNGTTFRIPSGFAAGNYRFWVQAVDSAGVAGPWSVHNDFTINPLPKVDISGVKLNYTIEGVNASLALPSLRDAAKLEIWVYSYQSRSYILKTDTQARTLQMPALEAGGYRIWIRAIDKQGGLGLWAAPVDFTIQKPSVQIRQFLGQLGNIDLSKIVVQVKDSKGVNVGTYRGPSETILGLLALKPGNYKVQVSGISQSLTFSVYHPAVLPTVTVGADQIGVVRWTVPTGDSVSIWIGQRIEGKLVTRHSASVTGSSYRLPALVPGNYLVQIQRVDRNGARSIWSPEVAMNIGGTPTVKVQNNLISWTYNTAPADRYQLMFINTVTGKVALATEIRGKSVNIASLKSLPKGTYVLRVCAKKGSKAVSQWSLPVTVVK
jgi:hypothetical protein